MGEHLARLPEVLALQAGRPHHAPELVLSGAIIAVLVPLAAFEVLNLATVATHELAEVLVIANGVRAAVGVTPPPTRPRRSKHGAVRTPRRRLRRY